LAFATAATATAASARTFASAAAYATFFATFHAVAEQVEPFFAHVLQLQAEVHQHLRGDAFLLAEQTKKNVFGAHIVVVQIAGFFHRIFDDLLRPGRLRQLAHGDHVGSALDKLLNLQPNLAQIDV